MNIRSWLIVGLLLIIIRAVYAIPPDVIGVVKEASAARITLTFYDADGVLVNPPTVACRVRDTETESLLLPTFSATSPGTSYQFTVSAARNQRNAGAVAQALVHRTVSCEIGIGAGEQATKEFDYPVRLQRFAPPVLPTPTP